MVRKDADNVSSITLLGTGSKGLWYNTDTMAQAEIMKVHNPNNLPTIPIADLLPTQGDLKDLTEKNYEKLKNTIIRRGFSYPVYVWEDDKGVLHLLDKHQRQRVLTTEGWNEPIPYLKVPAKDLQEAMARLLEITSQYATITQEGIDEFIGKYELNEAEVYESTSFDALTSYGDDEQETEVEEDEAPEVDESGPPKSKLGEIYQLGRHRVMCGDSLDYERVTQLLGGAQPDMVFTDPPYGMNYSGRGENTSSKILGDDTDPTEFYNIGSTIKERYVWGRVENYLHLDHKPRDVIIWKKNNFGMGSGYRGQYECCFYFGDFKGSDSDVWDFAKDSKYDHPTQKPVGLAARAIANSKPSIVIDYFGGSGSTLIACEQTDRTCYMMELDPKYVDVIRKRYHKFVAGNDEGWEDGTPAI